MNTGPISLEVHPLAGVGDIRFGMTRAEVRQTAGPRVASFLKALSTEEVDDFPDLQLHAHYGGDRLECLEGYGESRISFQGLPLLHLPYPALKSELHVRGFQDQLIDDLHVYLALGLAFGVDEDRVVSVTAFPEGYFDGHG